MTTQFAHCPKCRYCKEYFEIGDNYLKYGIRHYAHWNCKMTALRTQWARIAFIHALPLWKLESAPYGVIAHFELKHEVRKAIKDHEERIQRRVIREFANG